LAETMVACVYAIPPGRDAPEDALAPHPRDGRTERLVHAKQLPYLRRRQALGMLLEHRKDPLAHCERPDPAVEGGRPRSRDGALLCPAQFPGAPAPLAAHDLIGINSSHCRAGGAERGLAHPRKRACLTAIHNFFLTRPDETTAAERFFGQKPWSMFAAILASVEIPPAPLSPPRRVVG
jgi:hypothetical protein